MLLKFLIVECTERFVAIAYDKIAQFVHSCTANLVARVCSDAVDFAVFFTACASNQTVFRFDYVIIYRNAAALFQFQQRCQR